MRKTLQAAFDAAGDSPLNVKITFLDSSGGVVQLVDFDDLGVVLSTPETGQRLLPWSAVGAIELG